MWLRLNYLIINYIKTNKNYFENLKKFLKAPNLIISSFKERFDNTMQYFDKEFNLLIEKKSTDLVSIQKYLRPPFSKIKYNSNEININIKNINRTMNEIINTQANNLNNFSRLLNSNSVSSNLKKGYSIISKSKKIIKKSNYIQNNDLINIKFYDNSIKLKVKKIN